ncbi:MAG: DNA primase [Candidatus Poribacteria bacterium]|nr:MAG: DNA primase [Candidatus Poribacteria bacterium]
MRYSSSGIIEQIRGRIDIVQLMREYGVSLRRSGRNWIGRCPFHPDDTPSFSVSAEKGLYHCFGCGASGNIVTFVSQRENIPYSEALQRLAQRAGIPWERAASGDPAGEEERILRANRFAAEQFHAWLFDRREGRAALEYLRARGLSEETIRTLKLGYAPDRWDALLETMSRAGFSLDLLVGAGLVRRNENGRCYDVFRNRILFPIEDLQGRVVAFGGRLLGEGDQPKYLNTPETLVYRKSETLYLLHRSRRAIYEEKAVLVCEGYMDAIALWQAGFQNVVASLGTALSASHARLLKRFAHEVLFLFDGDEAGRRAILRGAPHFLAEEFRVLVVLLPEGSDPDEFLRSQGVEALRERVRSARPLIEFLIEEFARTAPGSGLDGKMAVLGEMAELLRHVSSPVRLREYAEQLAVALDLEPEDVRAELQKLGVRLRRSRQRAAPRPSAVSSNLESIEAQLLQALLIAPEYIPEVFGEISPSDFRDPVHQEIARLLWAVEREWGSLDPEALLERCEGTPLHAPLARLWMEAEELPEIHLRIRGCVVRLLQRSLQETEQEALRLLQSGEEVDEETLARELAERVRLRRAAHQRLLEINVQTPSKEG